MKLRRWLYCLAVALALDAKPTGAQIVPDRTLPVNSRVNFPGNRAIIDGGTIKGRNLFHSFQEFSIPTGSGASFNNSTDIKNIFTRITGSNISEINGEIGAKGRVNLFFLNPNGILFGKNARLNLGGNFLAATANSITFADNITFTSKSDRPVLSDRLPDSLEIGSGQIQILGRGHRLRASLLTPISFTNLTESLAVTPGKNLTLIGGSISSVGGIVSAPGGRIEIASLQGKVGINGAFTYDESVPGRISLADSTLLSGSGSGGASLGLYGKEIVFKNGSLALYQNTGIVKDGILDVRARTITINGATQTERLPGGIISESLSTGSAAAIRVDAGDILLKDGGVISTRTFGTSKGGSISIAADNVDLKGFSLANIASVSSINSQTFGLGEAGDLLIRSDRLSLDRGARLLSTSVGSGKGGGVSIESDFISLTGYQPGTLQRSAISASTIRSGEAGTLNIKGRRILLKDGGVIDASSADSGRAGNLRIEASESIEVSGTVPQSVLPTSITAGAFLIDPQLRAIFKLPDAPSGDSGNLEIITPKLLVNRQGLISASNQGSGNGGTLNIDAERVFLSSGGSITAATASGNSGDIFIKSSNIRLNDGSSITARANNNGNGGNIHIETDVFILDNSAISANAFEGFGGNIKINTYTLLRNQSTISASSELGIDGTVTLETLTSPLQKPDAADPQILNTSRVLTNACSLPPPRINAAENAGIIPLTSVEFIDANAMIQDEMGTLSLVRLPECK